MRNIKPLIITILILLLFSCADKKEYVDLIIYNARIYTVDSNFTLAESFAVKDGKFLDVGSENKILQNYIADEVIDLEGKPVYPGFIDPHCHFYYYGLGLQRNANLVGTKSMEEIVNILREHHKKYPSEWILGRGWDQNDWEIKEFPDKEILDEYFPDNPVYITRIDGHAALLNTVALQKAGIDEETFIEGGDIKIKDGELSGIVVDNAKELVRAVIPESSIDERTRGLLEAEENCFAVGLTSVADAGLKTEVIRLIDSLQIAGKLSIRIYAMLDTDDETYKDFVSQGKYKTEKLNVRSVKLYADGALGSRGALLTEPYSDDTNNYGLLIKDPDYYRDVCRLAYDNGFQVNTHAIGDSAVRMMLKIYGEFLKDKNDLRWRIEHSQVVNPNDINLYGKYSIIPSVQATHATSDMYWAEERLGAERIKWAYLNKALLEQNSWIPNGTDFPIEDINPIYTFYASVFRKDLEGFPENGFNSENALSREQALRSVTIWAAKAAFEEMEKGSIEAGKFADFTILDQDIMQVAEEAVPDTKVTKTYIAGEKVFQQ